MKHCVKKLLGLAFALALCLAVGGTALAQTPEFAEAPDTLPEQEMLAYEPYAAPAAAGMNTITGDGYTVTIPTTVTVDSTTAKGELMVKAQLKQYRTLNITMKPQDDKWTLKYQDAAAGANTPQVAYTLKNEAGEGHTSQNMVWHYDESKHEINYVVTDVTAVDTANIPLTVNVTDPSQATMSGTYSDTVSFEFDLTKQCFTYIINVYGQEVELTSEASGTSSDFGKKYKGLQAVNMAGNANAPYTEQYVLEYGINPDGTVMGAAPGAWQHTVPTAGEKRKAVDGTEKTFTAEDAADYALRWETLDQVTIDPAGDYATSEAAGDKTKTKTIDRNLVHKWYWLDVNGATDYAGDSEDIHGNQGARISGYVNMQVSVDGTNWSSWFWQSDGDDYWGQFPYGIQFKLGFHHVKNGYVYDTGTGTLENGFRIIANKQDTVTAPGDKVGDTTYYVYKGTLTGEPIDPSRTPRYCYIPCYKKGLTYMANQGTGGKEDVNGANKPRTNVLYQEGYELESPEDLNINPPSADMVFAGWSTKSTYTTGEMLYQPGDNVSTVNWENYTDQKDLNKRPQLNGTQDKQKRELYVIWKKSYTVKVQFGGIIGWTTWDDANQSFPEKLQGGDKFDEPAVELGTAYAYGNTSLTLSATENKTVWNALQAKIEAKTTEIATAVQPDAVWQLKNEYTTTRLPANGEVTIQIKRKRYLLNVIPALLHSDGTYSPVSNATDAEQYGTFRLKSCGAEQTQGGKVSYYQHMRNYGGSYEIYDVKANAGYLFVGFERPTDKGPTTTEGTGNLTGKNTDIHYFGDSLGREYTGDTIYVMYKKDMVTFDYNGGTSDGKTKQVFAYDDSVYFPQVVLTNTTAGVNFVGWSTKQDSPSDAEIFKLVSKGGDVQPGTTKVSSKVKNWPDPNNKVLYAVWSSNTGPNRAPAKKALTVRYHANFDPMEELALDLDPDPLLDDLDDTFGFDSDPLLEDVDDALEGAVKTVSYQPGEDVVLRNCMFKRSGYVFVGWNTEPDGTGRLYRVNGVPITDWAAGDTVDLYAQWKKPDHLKPVVDNEPFVPTDPDTPPEELDPGFGIDPDADPADEEGPADDADAVDDAPAVADEEAAAAPPEELDFGFGIDPDAAVGGPAPFVRW